MNKVNTGQPRQILCLGAHPDDIEIGCGGTILKLLCDVPDVTVHWVVFSATSIRHQEALTSAELFLGDLDRHQITIESFPDTALPGHWSALKEYMTELGEHVDPDIVLTHHLEDRHQDHRVVAELTWQTFRNHMILEYEIPKYEGDLTTPNVYFEVSEADTERKIAHISDAYVSQRDKPWFDRDAFMALLRLRGLESKAASKFAEGFHCRKMVF